MRRSSAWLGRQDSNLGWRNQNPLPYRLATPQQNRALAQAVRTIPAQAQSINALSRLQEFLLAATPLSPGQLAA